ncbi:uncharacterized protein Lmpt isoform X1 [Anabrus simplex]|uniref:uncharacterized protein Lmpt isoform X1 n=1 Tax=Anabrus simplex TaxID=316456 RepID=UPI0035A2D3FF
MGLLLSILVFSVGVLEVIACARHIQYGYLPEWAPRRHVLATGTSGLTKLRDRWRKKPSRSADFDNKTKKSGYDVSRSCDVPCYGGECHGPLSDKCGSLAEQSEDTSAADFISTDVGEFQLRYQEFEEVLPREANTSNIYEDSAIHQDYAVCGQCVKDVPAQVVDNCGVKIKQRPPNIENIVSEESENFHSRSQSPSPRKLKADISWPLFVPHAPVSRRPSTPTTAEEDGGQSPYFAGEFLTEEHIRSTQRPLSVRAETYHADQDITPLLSITSEDGTRSISRPLTVTSHGSDSMGRQKQVDCIPSEINSSVVDYETNETTQCVTNDLPGTASTIQAENINDIDLCSLSSRGSGSTDSTLILTTEEEKAAETCIKQKRRTSTTEYLPSHEEVVIISQKEVTPVEPIFAAQKEEPLRLKPVKTTAFEEARLETFISDPQFADTSVAPHNEARRSSILSDAPVLDLKVTEISGEDDSSALISKIQAKTAEDQPQVPAISMGDNKGSWVTQVSTKNDNSAYPGGGKEKKDRGKRRLKFDLGPGDSDSDFTSSKVNDIENSSESVLKVSGICNTTSTVEVTAIRVVDKIIDEAVARINKMKSEYLLNGNHWKMDHCSANQNLANDDVTDGNELRTEMEGSDTSNQTLLQPEPKSSECTTSTVYSDENTRAIDSGNSRTMESTPEKDIYNCGSVPEKAASCNAEEMTPCGPETFKMSESSSVTERHSKIDSKNTTSPGERISEKSNATRSFQKSVKFSGSVLPSDREKTEDKVTKEELDKTQTVTPEADETTVCEGSKDKVQLSKFSTSDNAITKGEKSTKTDEIIGCPSENLSQEISPLSCTTQDICSLRESDIGHSNNYPDSDHTQSSGNNSAFPITPKSNDVKSDSKMSNSSKNTNRTTQKGVECDAASSEKSVNDQRQQQQQQQSSESAPEAFWLIFSGEYTKAMSKDWHSGHFCCWQCDESLTGQRYVLRDDHPYCIKCYESVFANTCEECNRTIGIDSKDLSYKDKHWHEACFLCTKCRVSLVDKQFGSKADKIYCGNCYDAQFASRCDGCGEIFRAGTKKMEYKTRQWHEKCFCCCVCKTAIGTKSFIPREQEIYCATCYEEKFATRCVKCNKIITSGGVTYKNEPWHRECFTCTNCNTSLAGQRFTSRDEKPYCADCFGELFAKRCTSCSKPITGIGGTRFISFEDRHWHNDCFICASCKTSLVGRGFITDADDIICPECAKQKLM